MGEYADLQIREDIKRMHGFDPGDMSEDTPRKKQPKSENSKCPLCNKKVRKIGLSQHMKDKHKEQQ